MAANRNHSEPSTLGNASTGYSVIYADPPWRYEYAISDSRKIENQYPTMSLEEIQALEIPSASDSVLYLWATAPKLDEALEVMRSWGFNYRSCMVWDKGHIGMGYWFRNQHELLLVGVKGKFSPPPTELRVSSVYRENKGRHSVKPQHFMDIIERSYPDSSKLELFARRRVPGWEVWGNQAPVENTPTKTRLFDMFERLGEALLNKDGSGNTTEPMPDNKRREQ